MPSEFAFPARHPISSQVVVLNGETQSNIYEPFKSAKLFQVTPKNIIVPSTITGASITFVVSDGEAFNEFSLRNEDGSSYTVIHNGIPGCFPIPADLFAGWQSIYIVTNVAQVSNVTLTIVNYIV